MQTALSLPNKNKKKETYTASLKTIHHNVMFLGVDDCFQIKAFHQSVRKMLPAQQKGFLRPKSLESIRQHFNHGDDVLAVTEQGNIIAQCFIDYSYRHSAIVSGLCVAPEQSGKGLVKELIAQASKAALKKDKSFLCAKVGVKNLRSLNSLTRAGFDIDQTIYLHKENRYVHLLEKKIVSKKDCLDQKCK